MRRWVRKQLASLANAELPFSYSLLFPKEVEKDGLVSLQETASYDDGDSMFVNICIAKQHCSALQYDFETQIHFQFPDGYPFALPLISLEEKLVHPAVQVDKVLLIGYAAGLIDIAQMITHVYLVISEAIDDERNRKFVEDWNKHCRNKEMEGNKNTGSSNDDKSNNNIDDDGE